MLASTLFKTDRQQRQGLRYLQGKSSSSGSGGEPAVPSKQDVKTQAKEARSWIGNWRKKQTTDEDA